MASFGKQLEKFEALAMERFTKIKRGAILDLCTSIIMQTPVDKGHLRNNWFVSLGRSSVQMTDYPAPVGTATVNRVKQTLKNADHIVPVFFANYLDYAFPIEFDGHSRKAPNGMVRVNVARWDSIVKANVEKFT